MKKKNICLIIAVFLVVLMLIPIPSKLKDGGSIEYNAILYKYTKIHRINEKSSTGYEDGWELKILGIHVGGSINTYVSTEHIISIKNNDKIVNASTGSFCYKNGSCLDKIDFQDFKYDVITSYFNDRLYIGNLEGTIKSIELFDYSTKEFIDYKVDFTNDYIVTPSISGPYIFKINATYEDKKIEYYFMGKINEIGESNIDVIMQLKDNSLSNTGLTMIISNQSNIDLLYGNPYTIEEYKDGYWRTVNPINDMSFTLPAYGLEKNESKEIKISWKNGYGKLDKGKYRIVKDFDYKEDGKYISFDKYLEFEIK